MKLWCQEVTATHVFLCLEQYFSSMAVRSSHYHMADLFLAVGPADGRLPAISTTSSSQTSPFRGPPHSHFQTAGHYHKSANSCSVAGCGDWESLCISLQIRSKHKADHTRFRNFVDWGLVTWSKQQMMSSKGSYCMCVSRVFTVGIHDVQLWSVVEKDCCGLMSHPGRRALKV